MPVPNPIEDVRDRHDAPTRAMMQAAVFSCYLLVAIALLYSAWRISITSEMMATILRQQAEIRKDVAVVKEVVK